MYVLSILFNYYYFRFLIQDLNILVEDGTHPLEEQNTGVVVPQVECLLSEYEMARLRTTICECVTIVIHHNKYNVVLDLS